MKTPHQRFQTIPTLSTKRRPRFRRTPDKNIQLTNRDIDILRQVFKHRFLRSNHIVALLGDSSQPILRRLNLLFHHGYLDRPKDQLFTWTQGSQPLVYGLGNKGADILTLYLNIPPDKVDWAAKNQHISQLFLAHTLLVADVMVNMEVTCRQNGCVRFVETEEILEGAPERTQHQQNPLTWRANIWDEDEETPYHIGMVPDKMFGLQLTNHSQRGMTAYFFLEADRATMPVIRKNFRQTSFYKKMVGYYATWRQHLHTDTYKMDNFRVLTVTTSQERIQNLIAANKRLNNGTGSRLFLFTEIAHFNTSNPFEFEWINGKGETVRLLD